MPSFVAAYRGDFEDARSGLDSVLADRDAAALSEGPAVLPAALELAILVGDPNAVNKLMESLEPARGDIQSGPPFQSGGLVCVARLLGFGAAFLGEAGVSRTYYKEALEICQKVRYRPELALTRLGLAELLLEHYPDERDPAIEHLDFAIAEFREDEDAAAVGAGAAPSRATEGLGQQSL